MAVVPEGAIPISLSASDVANDTPATMNIGELTVIIVTQQP
jgi:hypothetical protein